MNFKLTADRLLVKRLDPETVTRGGIFIPDALTTKTNKGTVILVGPGRTTDKGVTIPIADIVIDNVVMFEESAGTKVTVEGEDFLVLKENEIIAIVE